MVDGRVSGEGSTSVPLPPPYSIENMEVFTSFLSGNPQENLDPAL
jgi:hypothetical protein